MAAVHMSSEVETAINSYMKSDDRIEMDSCVTRCVKEVESGRLKIVDLVAALGSRLTSKETPTRRRSMKLLADVISLVISDFFSDKEAVLLAEFFCARLEDHHSITPICIDGIYSLLKNYDSFGGDDVIKLVKSIFHNVTVQTLVQADRLTVYNIFEHLLAKRLTDMKSLGSEFVLGIVQSIDSEKDPRNLLVVFSLVCSIGRSFTLDVVAEELFEVVSCYYPIDFTPPPNSGITVTKQQLASVLNEVLTVTPSFAPYCLPLLLEKLASSIVEARIDSLLTLSLCCETYIPENVDDFSSAFWNLIKGEVFAQRAQTEELALVALTAITKCLSAPIGNNGLNRRLEDFISVLFEDCSKYLHEPPDKTVFTQSSKLLAAACSASHLASCAVVKSTLPLLLSEFHIRTQVSDRQGLLDSILLLLKAVSKISSHSERSALSEYKDQLTSTFISLLSNVNSTLRSRAVANLSILLACQALLSDDERLLVAKHALDLLLSDGDESVRNHCVTLLSFLAFEFSNVLHRVVLPVIIETLQKDSLVEDKVRGAHVDASFVLTTLASISVELSVVTEVVPVFLSHINRLLDNYERCVVDDLRCACISLKSVVSVMSSSSATEYFITWLLPRCVAAVIETCCTPNSNHEEVRQVVITELSMIIRIVVQRSNESEISLLTSSVIALLLHGDVTPFQSFLINAPPSLNPLERNSPTEHTRLVDVLSTVVCSLPLNMVVPNRNELFARLRAVSMYHADSIASEAASRCLAGLVNKTSLDSFIEDFLCELKSEVSAMLLSSEEAKRRQALTLCIWLLKAVVLRNHPCQVDLTQLLIKSLLDDSLAASAADGFRVVMTSDTTHQLFSTDSHAIITLMYRQRFFSISLPTLLTEYKAASSGRRHFYVTALTHLVQEVPKEVFLFEIKQLLPVLMQSLMSEESSQWLSSINTITDLVLNNPDVLHSHVDDLICRTLFLSAYASDMKIRLAAIRCLSELSSMPTHLTVRHQQKVLRELVSRLDDHKRLVRQEAARARNLWFLIGAGDA